MAQVNEDNIGTTPVAEDYDEICLVLKLCTNGEARGDVGMLQEAFHEGARMFGSLAGTRYDVPITDLFALAESAPADTGSYRSHIVSVQQIRVAVVAEDGYWGGSVSVIDSLQLARIDGTWKIVSKLFAHPGGEPPEGV